MAKIILIFSILIASIFSWRMNRGKKSGCFGFGYVALVAFMISCFALFITYYLSNSFLESVETYRKGEKCIAIVDSYSNYISKDSDGKRTTMYTPTYKIQTNDGVVHIVKDPVSSGKAPIVGDTLEVYYNKDTDKMFSWRASTFILFFGMLFMWFLLAFLFVGIARYAIGFNMDGYWKSAQKVGIAFFVPAIMIAFEALLIYALFYGNDVPLVVTIILVFFILVLGLGIIGFIKNLIDNGLPKWSRTSSTSWEADWDEIDDRDKEEAEELEEIDEKENEYSNNKREINSNYNKKY